MKKINSSLKKNSKKTLIEIKDYDRNDVSDFIDVRHSVSLKQIGIQLPDVPPTQVVSIRLPTDLLNRLRAFASQQDVPYQALIKLFLAEALKKKERQLAS